MLGIGTEKRQNMGPHVLGRIRSGSAKEDTLQNTPTSPPHPTISRTKDLSQKVSAGDLTPLSKPFGFNKALKLFQPRTSKTSKAGLKIAPSGAIVFTAVQSQGSSGSSILPGQFTLLFDLI